MQLDVGMPTIYALSALAVFILFIFYITNWRTWAKYLCNPYVALVIAAVVIRFLASHLQVGYENDINCFKAWASMLADKGFSNFYSSDAFTDYPPGYMYVLFFLGLINKAFRLDGGTFTFLVKLPAIVMDIVTGLFIYHVAYRKIKPSYAFLLAFAYLMNPAIIINSTVWGQVDSVYTFVILLSVYYLTQSKRLPAFLLFAAAILIKPQALIFGPVYLFAALDYLKSKRYKAVAWGDLGIDIAISAFFMLVCIVPFGKDFGFSSVINQYINTINSYPFATLNAYNFYSFMGANWHSVTEVPFLFNYSVWGIVFLVVIVACGLYLLWRNRTKVNYFFVAALLNTLVFMFSVRMHERYLYPTLVFLLIAYIYKPDKRFLVLFTGFSATLFVNCADVLNLLVNNNDLKVLQYTTFPLSALNMGLTAYMLYVAFTAFKPQEAETEQIADNPRFALLKPDETCEPMPSEQVAPMARLDYLLMFGLMAVYAVIAFVNLGNLNSPQTYWSARQGDEAIISLNNVQHISRMQFIDGPRENRSFTVSTSLDGVNWKEAAQIKRGTVFCWDEEPLNTDAAFIKLTATIKDEPVSEQDNNFYMMEVAFRDSDDRLLPVTAVQNSENLIDEQQWVPETSNYMNSMYFDEIYHGRTAFEFLHHLSVYEFTHPPLGKDFIALGVTIFGMTPFGWRFMGTLFGVLMIPLVYMFARRMFKGTWWAFMAAVLFTFDFMHFAQTRIATIDTYITFFTIAMYFFMYCYMRKSFYDTPLWKTFVPLGLSGVCMGLGIASKWPGMYAAAGLAVLFFYTLYRRYKEYLYAKRVDNQAIIAKFRLNTVLTLAFCLAAFVAVPLVIYVASYVYYLRTPSMPDGLKSVLDNQFAMYNYHAHLVSTHPYSSFWWEWPPMLRPIFYYIKVINDTIRSGISSFGNPAVWWGGIVAFFYCLRRLSLKYSQKAMFLVVAFLAQYLPWVMVSRTTYIYHYFPDVVFIVLMVVYFCKDYWAPKGRTKGIIAYTVVAVVLFILFYPVLSGMPVWINYANLLKWMPTWQLI